MENAADNSPPGPLGRSTREINVFRRLERHIQGKTISGLMASFPLLVTIIVLGFIIRYADGVVRPFTKKIPWEIPVIGSLDFTGVGLIALAILFYLAGLAVSGRFGRRSFDLTNKLLNGTPVVGSIYGLTQTSCGGYVLPVSVQPGGLHRVAAGRHDCNGICDGAGPSLR